MTTVDDWVTALVRSHQRLVGAVGSLTPEQAAGPSYDTEWSIAQVLSHLGSGAEIFELFLRAGADGTPAPGPDAFQPIWGRWNAKAPIDQVNDGLAADRAFLDDLGALDDHQRQSWSLEMFGEVRTLAGDSTAGLLTLRLGEHAVHTWDVVVMDDASAGLAPDAVDLLIDLVHQQVERLARPSGEPLRVRITTHQPSRQLSLTLDDTGGRLEPDDSPDGSAGGPTLDLPGEALIRLFYGRLDPEHTPGSVTAEGFELDRLRQAFPGF